MFRIVIIGKQLCRVVIRVRDCIDCIKYPSKPKRLQIPYLFLLFLLLLNHLSIDDD